MSKFNAKILLCGLSLILSTNVALAGSFGSSSSSMPEDFEPVSLLNKLDDAKANLWWAKERFEFFAQAMSMLGILTENGIFLLEGCGPDYQELLETLVKSGDGWIDEQRKSQLQGLMQRAVALELQCFEKMIAFQSPPILKMVASSLANKHAQFVLDEKDNLIKSYLEVINRELVSGGYDGYQPNFMALYVRTKWKEIVAAATVGSLAAIINAIYPFCGKKKASLNRRKKFNPRARMDNPISPEELVAPSRFIMTGNGKQVEIAPVQMEEMPTITRQFDQIVEVTQQARDINAIANQLAQMARVARDVFTVVPGTANLEQVGQHIVRRQRFRQIQLELRSVFSAALALAAKQDISSTSKTELKRASRLLRERTKALKERLNSI